MSIIENNLAANLVLKPAENLAANLAANVVVNLEPGQFWCRKSSAKVGLRTNWKESCCKQWEGLCTTGVNKKDAETIGDSNKKWPAAFCK